MKWQHAASACGLMVLLAGCSTPMPRPTTPPIIPAPTPAPVAPQPVAAPAPKPPATTWTRLRASFAMADCAAPMLRRAHRETHNKRAFEAHMKRALPVIDYIQRIAAADHVAGEFVLLPWVESHFHEVAPRRHRAAGMWQIMPITARGTGLPVSRSYDGRLDKIAATAAVMKLLTRYHKRWHDWRLADMAYNTGEYRMRRIIKAHGMPPAKPVIPTLPVGRGPRHHLVKLLAIACVIDQPKRFGIKLPTLEPGQRLQAVKLPVPAHLRQVAQLAGLPLKTLRRFNAGYRLASVGAHTPMQLLLPKSAAETLREGIAAGLLHENDAPAMYIVASGDSLWSIAQRFNVHVNELRQWNGLDGSTLHPGQQLQLEPPVSG